MSRLKQAYFKVTGSKLSQLNHPNALTFLERLLTKQIFLGFHSNDHYLHFTPELWVIPLLSSTEFVYIMCSSTFFTPLLGPLVSGENRSNQKSSKDPCQAPLLRFCPNHPLDCPAASASAAWARTRCPEPLCPAQLKDLQGVPWYKSIRGFLLVQSSAAQAACLQPSPPFSLEPTSPTRRPKGWPCSDIAAYYFKGKSWLLVEILVWSQDSAATHCIRKQTQNVVKEGLKDFELSALTDDRPALLITPPCSGTPR